MNKESVSFLSFFIGKLDLVKAHGFKERSVFELAEIFISDTYSLGILFENHPTQIIRFGKAGRIDVDQDRILAKIQPSACPPIIFNS